jgi:hypothetical protein
VRSTTTRPPPSRSAYCAGAVACFTARRGHRAAVARATTAWPYRSRAWCGTCADPGICAMRTRPHRWSCRWSTGTAVDPPGRVSR